MLEKTDDPLAGLMRLEGVPSGFAAARDGIDAMLRDRGLRRTSPEQTAESLLLGAHASAVLEGSASSLEEVRAGEGD
ncbi:MAG: oxidoreductase, partial [Nocardioides sp.]